MTQYIDKSALVAEIERLYSAHSGKYGCDEVGLNLKYLEDFIDTIEMKEVNTWHLQEKENIYDAFKDWNLHRFVCIMDDNTIQEFTGIRDETYDGEIYCRIDCVNDDYDDVDRIVFWIEDPLEI